MAPKWIECERKFSGIWFCLTSATKNKSPCVEFLNIFYEFHLLHSSSHFRSEIIFFVSLFISMYKSDKTLLRLHCFWQFLNIFVRQLKRIENWRKIKYRIGFFLANLCVVFEWNLIGFATFHEELTFWVCYETEFVNFIQCGFRRQSSLTEFNEIINMKLPDSDQPPEENVNKTKQNAAQHNTTRAQHFNGCLAFFAIETMIQMWGSVLWSKVKTCN